MSAGSVTDRPRARARLRRKRSVRAESVSAVEQPSVAAAFHHAAGIRWEVENDAPPVLRITGHEILRQPVAEREVGWVSQAALDGIGVGMPGMFTKVIGGSPAVCRPTSNSMGLACQVRWSVCHRAVAQMLLASYLGHPASHSDHMHVAQDLSSSCTGRISTAPGPCPSTCASLLCGAQKRMGGNSL